MKKIFPVILSLGMLLILFSSFHTAGGASGAAQSPSIGGEEQNEIERDDTPWFDEAWHYRRPVNIINNEAYLSYYQALIKIENSKFDFTHAKSDGSDIRFTGSDGTTELNYWIESWRNTDPQVAYIWVRVFPLVNGSNTIYLYYGHDQSVITHSDGVKTFDGFDDTWSNITGLDNNQKEIKDLQNLNNVESLLTWKTISGTLTISEGILTLDNGEGIRSTYTYPTYQHQAVGFKANYGSGNGNELGGFFDCSSGQDCTTRQRAIIGDLPSPSNPSDLFLINYVTSPGASIILEGTTNWHNSYHVYEIRWSSSFSEGVIDHGVSKESLTDQVPSGPLPIVFYSISGSNATLQVDWVYVRQYRYPEPIATVGIEQGYVDLEINMIDTPDPIPTNTDLSYLLTISNKSLADAAGVVVTDTLPISAIFVKVDSSPECNQVGGYIVCELDTIGANSAKNVTIVVNPTVDGVMTNAAVVGSPGYELETSNNTTHVETLVDSIRPLVNWEEPVGDGQIYTTDGGLVTLEVSATDNVGIDRVEFKWYYGGQWYLIDTAYLPISPDTYQITFPSEILKPNIDNPVEVYAFDLAGNENDLTEDKRQVIYIRRISFYYVYLPLAEK